MATQEELAGWIFQNQEKRGSKEFQIIADAYRELRQKQGPSQSVRAADLERDRKAYDPTNDMSGVSRFVAGYGKAGVDLARGAGQMIGAVNREDVAESRRIDAPLMNTKSGTMGNMAGSMVDLAPLAFIPGANTVGGGAAIGALSGLLQPSVSTEETAKNVGIGAAGSAAVPALMTAGKTAKSFIEPLYEGGRNKIVGRAIADNAATDPQALAQTLRSTKSGVPGVEYTVGEAAQNPSLAALQRTASQTNPTVMNEAAARQAANSEARTLALQGVAPDRGAAVTAREAAAKQLYAQADHLPVDAAQIGKILERPSMKRAISRAQELAAEKGDVLDLKNLTGKGAHYIKMAMDDMATASPVTGIGANEQRAIRDTLTDYLGKMEAQLPSYGHARTTYAQMSRPINQADVVEEIAKKGTNFRGDLTPAAYARALRDETAQKVTGQPNATLGKVMEPGQMSTLNSIKDDLLRQDFAQTAGKGAGSDTVQKLAYSNMLNQAGVPSAVRNFGPSGIVGNVAQKAGQIVYKDANEKLAEKLAKALLDPSQAATLVEQGMVTPQMAALANALKRGGTALGAATPAIVQANQR